MYGMLLRKNNSLNIDKKSGIFEKRYPILLNNVLA